MSDQNNKKSQAEIEQDYLDEIFEPGELERVVNYHLNEKGEHDPKLPPDWTEEDSIAAKERIESTIGSFKTFKMDVDRDTLVSIITNKANVPIGYPTAKESMQLPYDTRFRSYDELRNWFVERGYDIPEADLSPELDPEYIGSYDDVFEELQTVELKESFEGEKDHIVYLKNYLLKLKELGVTKIDRDYHRARRTMLADRPHAHELALRMQRHNPSMISEDKGIYAHEVDMGDMECPEDLRRSDMNRHLHNPDNLEYVGHEDNRKEAVDDSMGPTAIPDILKDLEDYAPGGPKQYKRPVDDEDVVYDSEMGDFVSAEKYAERNPNYDDSSNNETEEYDEGYYNDSYDEHNPSSIKNNKKIPNAFDKKKGNYKLAVNKPKVAQGYGGGYGGGGFTPTDVIGLGALGGLIGNGVKGAVGIAKSAASKGASAIKEIRSNDRANGMAKIAINEIVRANASSKDALNRVVNGINKSGEPASHLEQSQNIAELDLSLGNLGKKLKMCESSSKNSRVGFEEKKEILKNIGEAGEIAEGVESLPDDVKNNLSKQARDIAKLIADIIRKLFSRSNDSSPSPSV